MATPLLTPALRRRFAELGPQDYGDEAREIVAGHFFLPGTNWEWFAVAYDEDGGVPQLFCLVRGQEIELGYIALAELETARSPLGLAVERDGDWAECTLAELRRRLAAPASRPGQAAGYWQRGEDWWTAEEAEEGRVPSDGALKGRRSSAECGSDRRRAGPVARRRAQRHPPGARFGLACGLPGRRQGGGGAPAALHDDGRTGDHLLRPRRGRLAGRALPPAVRAHPPRRRR